MIVAREHAECRIEQAPETGLPAPRPYPHPAKAGRLWIKAGRYWIACLAERPPVILAEFYDTADIPGRV